MLTLGTRNPKLGTRNPNPMLLQADHSCLLVVDIQERLVPHMNRHESLVTHAAWLLEVAAELGVPVLVSEQYPKGLGPTVPAIRALAPPDAFMEKTHFSCAVAPTCRERLRAVDRKQIVLAGIEAHVCVLQTALGLIQTGQDVYVVAEAVSSRRAADVDLALQRMRSAGVSIVSREMVAFEWLHQSGTPQFKDISKRFLR